MVTSSARNVALLLLGVLVQALTAAAPASGFVRFDFDQRYLLIPHRYMKDRCFVKKGNEWHCFVIVGSDSAIGWHVPGNEVSFAHASTSDLRHWTIHPDVLSIGTGAWDERNIWAPDVIRRGDRYRMYYTGVDSHVVQSMGMAESVDLFVWRPSPLNPLYRPDSSWADWGIGRWSNCRDPDILERGDSLLVLNTTSTKAGRGAIDVASSADGLTWRDEGPLFVNTADSVLESVQLIEHDGSWFLFFSEQDVLGVSVLRAPRMSGPWNKGERKIIALGQAAEIFGDSPNTLISRHKSYRAGASQRSVVKIDSLLWDRDGNPVIGDDRTIWEYWCPLRLDDPDPLFRETGFEVFQTDSAFAFQPTFGENPSFRGEPIVVGAVGNSWIGTRERYVGPLTGTSEGGMVGDVAVGGIRSRDFMIQGTLISFLVSGGCDPSRLYLALCDARRHEILRLETGSGNETLEMRVWQTDSLYGRLVYVKIVDASPSGHINVDEIIEGGEQYPATDVPFPGYLFDPYPNPFSEQVYLPLRMDDSAALVIGIYDVAGRSVKRLYEGLVATGHLRFRWGGLDEAGRRVPAGVYFARVEADGVARSLKMIKIN